MSGMAEEFWYGMILIDDWRAGREITFHVPNDPMGKQRLKIVYQGSLSVQRDEAGEVTGQVVKLNARGASFHNVDVLVRLRGACAFEDKDDDTFTDDGSDWDD